jgi:hypothetical protein
VSPSVAKVFEFPVITKAGFPLGDGKLRASFSSYPENFQALAVPAVKIKATIKTAIVKIFFIAALRSNLFKVLFRAEARASAYFLMAA